MENYEHTIMNRPEWADLTDEEVIEIVRRGGSDGADAVDLLLERYKDLVRVKTRPYFLLGADRADLIQEGMIGLYKAIMGYRPGKDTAFRSFADLCIGRQILTAVKNATRMKHWPLNSYISLNKTLNDDEEKETTMMEILAAPQEDSPEETLISKEEIRTLQKRIDKHCSPFEHRVLSLYLQGYDYHQIAKAMGKTPKSIDNALQRIKKKVQQIAAEV